jgi:hypothetical protein
MLFLLINLLKIIEILDQIRSLLLAVDPRILMFAILTAGFVLILVPIGPNIAGF